MLNFYETFSFGQGLSQYPRTRRQPETLCNGKGLIPYKIKPDSFPFFFNVC